MKMMMMKIILMKQIWIDKIKEEPKKVKLNTTSMTQETKLIQLKTLQKMMTIVTVKLYPKKQKLQNKLNSMMMKMMMMKIIQMKKIWIDKIKEELKKVKLNTTLMIQETKLIQQKTLQKMMIIVTVKLYPKKQKQQN